MLLPVVSKRFRSEKPSTMQCRKRWRKTRRYSYSAKRSLTTKERTYN